MSTPTDTRQRQWFIFFLLALLPAGNAVNPCLDVDTWWHLAVGRTMVEQRAIPTTDPYSRLSHEKQLPWLAYSWLYDLLLYETETLGGLSAILALKHILGTLTFVGIAWFILQSRRNWLALGILALVTISLVNFMTERPWHVTIFCTTMTLHVAYRLHEGEPCRKYLWLPLVYILWANIHIQFVMGLAILGLGFGVALLESFGTRNPNARQTVRNFLILGSLCTLATLMTPFHVRLYGVVWEYATQTQVLQLVSELQPPDFRKWWNWPFVVLGLSAGVVVIRRRVPMWDLAIFASALFFGLRMQRDLWYAVLACAAVILRSRDELAVHEENEQPRPLGQSLAIIIGLAGLAVLLIRVVWAVGFPDKTMALAHRETYPVASVEYIKANRLAGPLFNNFDWGGYLIWNLPELPVSIDGRTNLYGEARLLRSVNTWAGEAGWADDPDLLSARVIVAPKPIKDRSFALTELLKQDPRWRIAFEEETAIVFVANPSP